MELLEKLACVFLSGGILVTALVVRRLVGAWSAPGALYSLFWFGYTFIPLVVLPTVPASPLAMLYILASCVAFSVGAGIRRWDDAWRANAERAIEEHAVFDTNLLRYGFYGCAGLSIICLIVDLSYQGVPLSALASNLLESAQSYIQARYSGSVVQNIFAQLGNVLSYMAAGLGGLVLAGRKGRYERILIIVAAMLPSVFVMLVQGAKGMLFLSITMFFASIIVRRLMQGDRRLIERRQIFQIAIGLVVLFPIVTASFLARGLYENASVETVLYPLLRYYASYSSGHLYAFSDWYTAYVGGQSILLYPKEEATYGFYTYMATFQAFGDDRYVAPGVYQEYFRYGHYLSTNIFTHYRGLITDFGIVGSLIYMVVTGVFAHEVYHALIANRRPSASIAAYITIIGCFYTSFIISLLIWDGPIVTFIGLWLVLYANARATSQARLVLPIDSRVGVLPRRGGRW